VDDDGRTVAVPGQPDAMTTPHLADVPVTTQRELRRRWAAVLEPPVFAARSMWIMWLRADGSTLPTLVPIDELPREPDARTTTGLVDLAGTVADEHTDGIGHVAFALCRSGQPTCSGNDQAWADGLQRAAGEAGLSSWSLHLAAGGAVLPLVAPPWPRGDGEEQDRPGPAPGISRRSSAPRRARRA